MIDNSPNSPEIGGGRVFHGFQVSKNEFLKIISEHHPDFENVFHRRFWVKTFFDSGLGTIV